MALLSTRHGRRPSPSLTSRAFPYRPLFVPFGMGDADTQTLRKLDLPGRSQQALHGPRWRRRKSVITNMVEAMLSSIVSSAQSAAAGSPQVVLPNQDDVGTDVRIFTVELEEL